MTSIARRMSYVAQNVILGTVTGVMVGYNLKVFFQRVGGTEMVWVLFLLLGPLLGFLSGKERQRLERLRKEKTELKENLGKIQASLKSYSQKYRLLVEYANDAIFLTTEQGRFLLFNQATCSLSGYPKNELKSINVADLRATSMTERQHRAWSDNGFSRYEERWQKKDGTTVHVEANARLIRLGEHRLILRVVRDIIQREAADDEEKAKQIRAIHESRIIEIAETHQKLFNQLLNAVRDTQQAVQENIVSHPGEASAKLSVSLSDWEKNRKSLQVLMNKCHRDLKTSPARWDLNAVLREEVVYLKSIVELGGCIKELDLTKQMPPVYGFGRDFSFAIGDVLKAAVESVRPVRHPEISIVPFPLDDHVMLEIRLSGAVAFKERLAQIIDPSQRLGEELTQAEIDMKFNMCRTIFESFGARIDVGKQERGGTIIRLRFPVVVDDNASYDEATHADEKASMIM